MTTRKKIFILSGIIAGFLVGIILLYLFLREKPVAPIEGVVSAPNSLGSDLSAIADGEAFQDKDTGIFYNTNIDLLGNGLPKQDITAQYLRQFAGIFVERFNSYSNQDDNKHIEEALGMSTEKMARWINTQKIAQSRNYEAVVTEVLSTSIEKSFSARVVVKIQAKITKITSAGKVFELKTGQVDLLKGTDDNWLVDRFAWE